MRRLAPDHIHMRHQGVIDDATDDQQRRRLGLPAGHVGGQTVETGKEGALIGRGAALDDSDGRLAGKPRAPETPGETLRACHPHIHHQGAGGVGQPVPIEIKLAVVLAMPGQQTQALGDAAMGQRNAGGCGAAGGGGDTGHHLEGDARFGQGLGLFTAATEDIGIAALEAHYPMPGLAQADQDGVDFLLRHRMAPGFLAHIDAQASGRQQVKHGIGDQTVEHRHIGGGDQARRLQGQQFRVAGAGAHQIDFACHDLLPRSENDRHFRLERCEFIDASASHFVPPAPPSPPRRRGSRSRGTGGGAPPGFPPARE
ncbi:protein of unknown function [Magnetospirillum gryphiswaldense MSR-1 v2]|uniref:Uncharacterized protein n=1 Tax=Magnetospirillum gryphiswaldense (strain DSM 6361 / JCM 21280 / NBRC 15271 / MSR-1) TaxID=431944 RepID=V6EZD2_MAGGM|nr:protein of unknown function [Magnetospirillum gryphiswaldense MSR-1 v2]